MSGFLGFLFCFSFANTWIVCFLLWKKETNKTCRKEDAVWLRPNTWGPEVFQRFQKGLGNEAEFSKGIAVGKICSLH